MTDLIDKSELMKVLQGFNPWWSGRDQSVPSLRRIAYQVCLRHLLDPHLRRGILLSGPRRVGKTTILLQIAQHLLDSGMESAAIFYVSLDHPLLKLVTLPRLLQLYHEQVLPGGKHAVLLLDEIQYSTEWDLHLKQIIDHRPEYRLLATGSASVAHRERLVESGVGRWVTVQIPTLSFFEFLHIRGEDIGPSLDRLKPRDLFTMAESQFRSIADVCRPLMPLFQRYLLVGGFPETARQADIAFCQRLLREDVVERVLRRDMVALFGIRNVGDLEKLFIYLCMNSGGILAVNTCAKQLETSRATVENHLRSLEQANLIYRLPPHALGGKKVLRARDKVYLVDAALRNAVLLRNESVLTDPTQMGMIVETTVLRHLFAYYYADTPCITYWRDKRTQEEVDIIVKSPAYTIPTEIKYRQDANLAGNAGLVKFCSVEKADYAYWITAREEDFDVRKFPGIATRFLRIPAHIFCYLLGQAERTLWET